MQQKNLQFLLKIQQIRKIIRKKIIKRIKIKKENDAIKKKITEYKKPTTNNPLGNVLLTEIHDNPTRKSAPPAFYDSITDEIFDAFTSLRRLGSSGENRQASGSLLQNDWLSLIMEKYQSFLISQMVPL